MNAPQRHNEIAALAAVRPAGRTRVLEVVGNGIVGGMETCVLRLLERLPREQFHCTVLAPYEGPFSDRVRALGFDCFALPMPDDPSWSALQTASALVHSQGIDVLHAHMPNAHALAALAGRLTGRPVLATIHGRELTLRDLEAHRAAGTTVCTVCRHSELHALGLGVDPSRLECIVNGVDTASFRPQADDAQAARWRARWLGADATDGALLIGFVGRLSPEKGPDDFVHAALLLSAASPAARFVIVGDGPLRSALAAQLAALRLDDRVHLAGELQEMPSVYRALDLLVSSSHSEAMPLALMEAMACALPLVATRVGGVPDMVAHGATGLLCNAGDVRGLANATGALARDPARRAAMGAAARARVLERFDLARQIDATARLLARLGGTAALHDAAAATRTRS